MFQLLCRDTSILVYGGIKSIEAEIGPHEISNVVIHLK